MQLTNEERRDLNAWLTSIEDYRVRISKLSSAIAVAVERIRMICDDSDLPLGSDDLFPLSGEYYEQSD